ncbi:hypothetical protein ES708_22260 [subsurface metagenome]
MELDKFTIKSQEAIQRAQQLTMEAENQAIECGHLLKGILEIDENVLPFLFKKLAINEQNLIQALNQIIKSYPKVSGGQVYLSNTANQALVKAQQQSKEFGDEYVSLEHLLLGLMRVKDNVSGLLKDSGLNEKDVRAAINELHNSYNFKALFKYSFVFAESDFSPIAFKISANNSIFEPLIPSNSDM